MPDDRDLKDLDAYLDPEDVNSPPANAGSDPANASSDPADDVPVPIVMSPAEIDERAQALEALRGKRPAPKPEDDQRLDG